MACSLYTKINQVTTESLEGHLTTRFMGFAEVGSYIILDKYHRSVSGSVPHHYRRTEHV
jgi:hypothetical protein